MKLVEILARELEVWPEGCRLISQLSSGELLIGSRLYDLKIELAEDWLPSIVTRPQWQAERDRMKAMEKIEQGIKQFENDADAFKRNVGAMAFTADPTYEQQLWDRVALDVHTLIFEEAGSKVPVADIAYAVAQYADAFMAERAKRVGK